MIRDSRQLSSILKSLPLGLPGEREQQVQRVLPWKPRPRLGRAKDQKAFRNKLIEAQKQTRKSQEDADKSEGDDHGRHSPLPGPLTSARFELDTTVSPLRAPGDVAAKRELTCRACGQAGHNISGCKRPSVTHMIDTNPGTKNKILRGHSTFIDEASTFTSASAYLARNDVVFSRSTVGTAANLSMDANENHLFSNVFQAFGIYAGSEGHLPATDALKKHLLERKLQSKGFISEDYLDYLNVYVRLNWDKVEKP